MLLNLGDLLQKPQTYIDYNILFKSGAKPVPGCCDLRSQGLMMPYQEQDPDMCLHGSITLSHHVNFTPCHGGAA